MITVSKKAGVYKIKIYNKIYIGSSGNCYQRRAEHLADLRLNKHINKHLQRAFNKYTEKEFSFNVIEYCDNEEVIKREQFYLDTLLFAQEYLKGEDKRFRQLSYNLRPIANSNKGYQHSAKAKTKMKRNCHQKGKPRTDAEKLAQSLKMKGRYSGENSVHFGKKASSETKLRMSIACTGRKLTEEHKIKIGRKGESNKLFGTKRSEITRIKISLAKIGKPAPRRTTVIALNLENGVYTEYDFALTAALEFNCSRQNIQLYVKTGKPYRNHVFFYNQKFSERNKVSTILN